MIKNDLTKNVEYDKIKRFIFQSITVLSSDSPDGGDDTTEEGAMTGMNGPPQAANDQGQRLALGPNYYRNPNIDVTLGG